MQARRNNGATVVELGIPPALAVGSVNGRLDLIRQYKNVFKRLDAADDVIRGKILQASTNAELDNLFDAHRKI